MRGVVLSMFCTGKYTRGVAWVKLSKIAIGWSAMQPHKTSSVAITFVSLIFIGAYAITQAWWLVFSLAALVSTVILQWQVAQIQQRIVRLEQQQEQAQAGQNSFLLRVDVALWILPLALAAVVCLAVYWQHRLGMLLSAIGWLGYFVWVLLELQQRLAQLEHTAENPVSRPVVVPTSALSDLALSASVQSTSSAQLASWMQQPISSSTSHSTQQAYTPNHTQATLAADAHREVIGHSASSNNTLPIWIKQTKQWLIQGNPILKVAVVLLLVGVVLLLRFASEHWQLSLAAKLGMITSVGAVATALAYRLRTYNELVSIAVQGVGLAIIFLSLIFAQQNHVLQSLGVTIVLLVLILATTCYLSLKQSALYLTILALGMAYLAPLIIPKQHPDVLMVFGYYLLINIAVAIINHIQGWKVLNHLAFAATMIVAGSLLLSDTKLAHFLSLDALLWLHIGLFVFVSIRYSQLLVKQQTLKLLNSTALLDVSLIFSVPVIGFSLHAYLMQNSIVGLTLGASALALIYAALVLWIRRYYPELRLLASSFLILSMVFLALIFPLAQGAHWSAIGWVVQGSALLLWGVSQSDRFSRYIGVILLLLSSIALLYQVGSQSLFPTLSTAIYAAAMFVAAATLLQYQRTQQQNLNASILSTLFLSLALYAGALVGVRVLDIDQVGLSAYLGVVMVLFGLFSLWMHSRAQLNWHPSHLFLAALLLLLHYSIYIHLDVFRDGTWENTQQQLFFTFSGIALSILLLFAARMLHFGFIMQQLWVSITLLALASIGLAVLPQWGLLAMAFMPLAYAIYVRHTGQTDALLQQPISWLLTLLWLMANSINVVNSMPWYVLPILNPNDFISLVVLLGVLRLIFKPQHASSQSNSYLPVFKMASLLVALLVVSSLLIRALHVYAHVPLNASALWQSGIVQLSLTLLWMFMALLITSYASRKQQRQFWYAGAALLGFVVIKLLLLDLVQTATITRVFSFIAAGALMTVIAYIAPRPPAKSDPH